MRILLFFVFLITYSPIMTLLSLRYPTLSTMIIGLGILFGFFCGLKVEEQYHG